MSLTKTSAINISKVLAVVLIGAVTASQLNIDLSKYASLVDFGRENPYREVNKLLNGAFYSFLSLEAISEYLMKNYGPETGYYLVCYVRDLIAGTLVYWLTAVVWHIMIYHVFRKSLFTDKGRPLPTWDTIFDQMALAQSSLFVYAGLPILSEYFIESGFTRTYFYVSDIGGWKYYFAYLFLYFVFFEVGIYWVHRTLHTNKFLYKYVHGLHHKYNQSLTLTPWASIAFNPIDGILQASPYVVGLFFLPVHYFTHVFLLFFSGVWATNIHDSLWGDTEPIMGSKYHTMHHTHYHYNFGQFFIFCDYFWGSFRTPDKTKFD